jgi:hypothetical protein
MGGEQEEGRREVQRRIWGSEKTKKPFLPSLFLFNPNSIELVL